MGVPVCAARRDPRVSQVGHNGSPTGRTRDDLGAVEGGEEKDQERTVDSRHGLNCGEEE